MSVLVLPLLVAIDIFRSPRSLIRKLGYLLLILVALGLYWFHGYSSLINLTKYFLWQTGVVDKITQIKTSGRSMLPTIKDGEEIDLHNPKKFGIERGDVVTFQNVETGEVHYVKRVIGLEGETISIVNGQIKIDGHFLKENYVYQGKPTYGNTYLIECQNYTIPQGKVAVFGDNRLASTDSRVIGFVDKKDIDGVIKTKTQISSTDQAQPPRQVKNLDSNLFLLRLNEVRKASEASPLLMPPNLSQVAAARASTVAANLKGWKAGTNEVEKLLTDIDYDFLLVQEIVTMGNYDADELVEHLLELYPYRQDVLSQNYAELGIGTAEAVEGACQIPVTVVILTWPTKPNYSQENINRWRDEIALYSDLIATLKGLTLNPKIDVQATQKLIADLSSLLEQVNRLQDVVLEGRWPDANEAKMMETYSNQSQLVQRDLGDYVRQNLDKIDDLSVREFLADYRWGNTEFNNEAANTQQLYSQGKYNEQLTSAGKLIELARNDEEKAIGYYWQGLAYFNLNQNASAKKSLFEAIKLNPHYAAPYVTLSAVSFNENDYQQGYQYALLCVALDPNYGWCHNNLGLAYMFLGQKSQAVTELEKAIYLDPTSYVFNDNLKRIKAN